MLTIEMMASLVRIELIVIFYGQSLVYCFTLAIYTLNDMPAIDGNDFREITHQTTWWKELPGHWNGTPLISASHF